MIDLDGADDGDDAAGIVNGSDAGEEEKKKGPLVICHPEGIPA